MKQVRLGKQDWLQAGFRALAKDGPAGLRIEPIARSLGVSKGSFYWHFRDAGALKEAMLSHWVEMATETVMRQLEAGNVAPEDRLRNLIRKATTPPDNAYGGAAAEPAIRDWARYDSAARTVVQQVDNQRIAFTAGLLQECGFAEEQALRLGAALYSALVGGEALAHHCDIAPAVELPLLLEAVLGLSR